jgi:hypothetical protein
MKLLYTMFLLVISLGVSGCFLADGGSESGGEDALYEEDPPEEESYLGELGVISSVEFFGDKTGGKFLTYLAHVLGQEISGTKIHFAKAIEVENLTETEQHFVLSAQLQGYSQVGTKTITLPPGGVEVFHIDVSLDFSQLYSVSSPVAGVAEVKLETPTGQIVDIVSRTLQIQSKNTVFWEMQNSEGQFVDLRPAIVTLVTPQDKDNLIEGLITEAGNLLEQGAMVGYQSGQDQVVVDQAAALYNALKQRGMIYTHVPGNFFDGSQNVKLPAESLSTGSQNCIDGTLVFASAFEALGMRPLIIFVPGHAFVALLLGPQSEYAIFIETTAISTKSAEEAMQLGLEAFEKFDEQTSVIVDVFAARSEGLTPVNL